ncbi:MAG TPA: acetate--CoA ligase family protein [bacterium]|nr:acetate--CoA ligase family protein [bacterium]
MIGHLFGPKSVAVVGASLEERKVGYAVLNNMVTCGYQGKLYPVNPKGGEMMGRKVYKTLNDIDGFIELVVFVIPPLHIMQAIRDAKPNSFDTAIIISAGFKETGPDGAKLENELKALCKERNIRVMGPNCLGFIDTMAKVNASFSAGTPVEGNIAFFTQSGALGTAVLDWAIKEKIGMSKFMSLGNKMDMNEVDMLEALADDPDTHVILGYLEGIVDGRRFIDVAQRVSKKKPIIITKSGSTAAGARAISSHTGTLAGSENAYKAAFEQFGIIRSSSVEELFDLAMAFSYQSVPKGDNMVIVTNAGGPGIIAADAVEKSTVKLASLTKETVDKLKEVLPPVAALYNPVDIIGDARDDRYKNAVEILEKDPNVDSIMVILTPQSMTNATEIARAIADTNTRSSKPIFTSFMGGGLVEEGARILNENKVPNYLYPERAVNSIEAMINYRKRSEKERVFSAPFGVDKKKVKEVIARNVSRKVSQLPETDVREILQAYGFTVPKTLVAESEYDAVYTADTMGYPVVLKVCSPDIIHKSDIGGVKVNLKNADEVRKAYFDIMASAKKAMPQAVIHGVQVCEMCTGGKEVILGMTNDPTFGQMLMFGMGGVYVEVLKDVAFRIAPITGDEADGMVREIKMFPLLQGVRGEAGVDLVTIREALLRLSQLVCDFPEIMEMDINPLKVYPKASGKTVAIDARMTISVG